MFSSKKDSTGVKMAKLATLVAHNVHISGDLEFSEGLRMDGQVTGNVSGRPGEETLLVVSDQGAIRGNVSAYDVIINGCVTGDVTVAHFVELQSNARVLCNIYYQQLRMDIGATVEGKLTKLDSQSAHVPTLPSPTEYAVDFSTT